MLFSSIPSRSYPYRGWLIITAEVAEGDSTTELCSSRTTDPTTAFWITTGWPQHERRCLHAPWTSIVCPSIFSRSSFDPLSIPFRFSFDPRASVQLSLPRNIARISFVTSLPRMRSNRLRCSVIERFMAILHPGLDVLPRKWFQRGPTGIGDAWSFWQFLWIVHWCSSDKLLGPRVHLEAVN